MTAGDLITILSLFDPKTEVLAIYECMYSRIDDIAYSPEHDQLALVPAGELVPKRDGFFILNGDEEEQS